MSNARIVTDKASVNDTISRVNNASPNNVFAITPPTTAPPIPINIDVESPPLTAFESEICAIYPVIAPNVNQSNIFIDLAYTYSLINLREKWKKLVRTD